VHYLRSRLNQVIDCEALWDLFSIKADLVAGVAELANPVVGVFLPLDRGELRVLVEDCLTGLAKFGVSSCHFGRALEAVKSELEDVRVDLLAVLGGRHLTLLHSVRLLLLLDGLALVTRVIVGEIHVAVEVVRVNFLAG